MGTLALASHRGPQSRARQYDWKWRAQIPHGQVYLAVPSNCPYHPDGSKRSLSGEEKVAPSVIMYVSDDEGTTFTEVSPHSTHRRTSISLDPCSNNLVARLRLLGSPKGTAMCLLACQ